MGKSIVVVGAKRCSYVIMGSMLDDFPVPVSPRTKMARVLAVMCTGYICLQSRSLLDTRDVVVVLGATRIKAYPWVCIHLSVNQYPTTLVTASTSSLNM